MLKNFSKGRKINALCNSFDRQMMNGQEVMFRDFIRSKQDFTQS